MAFHYFTPDEARMALASIMAIDEKSYKLQEEREQDRNARDTALPLLRQLRALRLRRKLLGVLLQTLAPLRGSHLETVSSSPKDMLWPHFL
ncbi:unnamed protein product [Effrenium voratum]|nr:unnamed protein product [Effrenium voratum]